MKIELKKSFAINGYYLEIKNDSNDTIIAIDSTYEDIVPAFPVFKLDINEMMVLIEELYKEIKKYIKDSLPHGCKRESNTSEA